MNRSHILTITRPKLFLLKFMRLILLSIYLLQAAIVALVFVLLLLNERDWTDISTEGVLVSRHNLLLWCLVMSVGLALAYAGRRFPLLRLKIWEVFFILPGTILGFVAGTFIVSYKFTCCMFAYTIVSGYPFAGVVRGLTLDTYEQWPQIYLDMQRYPAQIQWDIAWVFLILNGLFYAYASFILIITLHIVIRGFVRLRKR